MPGDNGQEARVGLAEAIANLRAELSRARREGEGHDIRFAASEITVELAVEFGSSREAGGGFKLFSFVDVSGKAGATDKATHKVTLKLQLAKDGTPADQLIKGKVNPHQAVKPGG